MNDFERSLLKYFSKEQMDKIRNTSIGIAGAGGLGSNCAVCLVRSGFAKLSIYDFDVVEMTNLNRQFYFDDQVGRPKVEALASNLKRINPSADIKGISMVLTRENVSEAFASCDAVVEAFDKPDQKKMLAEALAGSGKFYVSAAGVAGWGKSDLIVTRSISPGFHIVGDGTSCVSDSTPPCAPRVSIAAAKQADMILEWVLGENV